MRHPPLTQPCLDRELQNPLHTFLPDLICAVAGKREGPWVFVLVVGEPVD